MALTKRQIVTALSVVYLSALTALAAYALRASHIYSLPIPDILCALTVALPALAGMSFETLLSLHNRLVAKGAVATSRPFQLILGGFIIYETVLATLAGTHISPAGSLNCALREKWDGLFQAKDGDGVKAIQDAFQCCGFASTRDMAFPFFDAQHGHDACMVRYERTGSCLEPWRNEEVKVAVMLLLVPLLVFVWKITILLAPSSSSSWLPHPYDSTSGNSGRRIAYRDIEESARDGADDRDNESIRDEVARLNSDSNLASHIESERVKSVGLWREHNAWRGDD